MKKQLLADPSIHSPLASTQDARDRMPVLSRLRSKRIEGGVIIVSCLSILSLICIPLVDAKKKKMVWNKSSRSSLTMGQAVHKAYKHKPSLLALKHTVRAGEIGEKESWVGYYPVVNLESTLRDDLHGNTLSTTTFNLRQLVLDFAGPHALYKRAKNNTAMLKFKEHAEQNIVRFTVEQLFLNCWKLQQQYDAMASLRISSRATYDQAVTANAAQLLDRNVWLKSVEDHANKIAQVYTYDDSVRIAQKTLEFLMGYSLNLNLGGVMTKSTKQMTKLSWDDSTDVVLKPLNHYYKAAQRYRPEIKMHEKLIEIQQNSYDIAARSRLPKLYVGASASRITGVPTGQRSSHNFSGTMSWNLFDGLKSDYAKQKIHAKKLEALLAKQQVEQQVKKEVETVYHQVSQQLIALTAEKFRYIRARNEFVLRKTEHKVGTISSVVFEQAKTAWKDAQFSWFEKRVNAEVKNKELSFRCGYFSTAVV